jgi:hypothetical protein
VRRIRCSVHGLVQASKFACLPDRSYRCSTAAGQPRLFTSGQNALRYLHTHRICYPSEYRQFDGTRTFTLLDSQPCRLLILPSCYSSYEAWTFTPVGIAPTDHASFRWTHTYQDLSLAGTVGYICCRTLIQAIHANPNLTRSAESDLEPSRVYDVLAQVSNIPKWAPVFADAIEHIGDMHYQSRSLLAAVCWYRRLSSRNAQRQAWRCLHLRNATSGRWQHYNHDCADRTEYD